MSEHALSGVICREDTRLMHRPSDPDVNWMSPVQGKSPPVQVKEPFDNLDKQIQRIYVPRHYCLLFK